MEKVTVILNTFNEVTLLKDCLESIVGHVDEIVVTDMFSTDGSKELSEKYGCRVISIPPAPIVEQTIAQKVLLANNEWILAMDPDMRVPEKTWIKIEQLISDNNHDVIIFYLKNFFFEKWIKYGHSSGCQAYRLFRKSFFLRNGIPETQIHGMLTHTLSAGRKYYLSDEYFIEHIAYNNAVKLLHQHLRYAENEAHELIAKGYKTSLVKIFYKICKKIIKDMIISKGILDGKYAFIYTLVVIMMIIQRELIVLTHNYLKSK